MNGLFSLPGYEGKSFSPKNSKERLVEPVLEKKTKIYWLFILPGCIFLAVFMLIPLFTLIIQTFFDEAGSFSLTGYLSLLESTYFKQVFGRSIRLSLISTLACGVLGFPTAYYISKYSKNKGMLMALAVFPMFTSPVIRSFSWMVILGKKGFVNKLLVDIGLVDKPLSLLYNEFSMVIGFIQLFLPLMILSLIGIMDNISEDFESGGRKPGSFQGKDLPLCSPSAKYSRTGNRECAGVYRLSHSLHYASVVRRYGHPGAGYYDLPAGHVFRRLDAGVGGGSHYDRGNYAGFQRYKRCQQKVESYSVRRSGYCWRECTCSGRGIFLSGFAEQEASEIPPM